MQATPFDFDVITGPSLPRDDRKPEPQPVHADQPAPDTATKPSRAE